MKIENIDVKYINADPNNPRSKINKEEVEQLMKSIESDGQFEPIHIEKLSNNSYLVTEGNTRLAAIKKSNKINMIDAIVSEKLSKEDRLFKQIAIDTHRNNWTIFDRDKSWKKLWDMGKHNSISFAKKINVTKAVADSFVNRISIDESTRKKLTKISGSNIDEAMRIKDKKLMNKVLLVADKKEVGRIEMRTLTHAAPKVSKEVLDDYSKGKITIDDVENMANMSSKAQKIALETTKGMNNHKRKLKTMIEGGKIKTEDKAALMEKSKAVDEMQKKIFKISADVQTLSHQMKHFSKTDIAQYKNTALKNILNGVFKEIDNELIGTLNKVMTPAITKMKKDLGLVK